MTKTLRILALVLAATAAVIWLATGGNRGWTKTSVPTKAVDEVTGLESITYERRFVPGVDFLGAALLGAALLAAGSFLFRQHPTPH